MLRLGFGRPHDFGGERLANDICQVLGAPVLDEVDVELAAVALYSTVKPRDPDPYLCEIRFFRRNDEDGIEPLDGQEFD